jgi:hypothetical protein
LLEDSDRKVSDRIEAYALYIDPPLGRAGLTEAQARKTGRAVLVSKRPMTQVGRAVEKDETQGFMKAIVDSETKKVLDRVGARAHPARRPTTADLAPNVFVHEAGNGGYRQGQPQTPPRRPPTRSPSVPAAYEGK